MASTQGCLKTAGLGCLGLIVILIVAGGFLGLTAKRAVDRQVVEDVSRSAGASVGGMADAGPGRVVLDLHHGAFELEPAPPGQGVTVSATYDTTSYELVDELVALDDGRWEYRVGFRSRIPLLKAILMDIVGDVPDPEVKVQLPVDVPLDLDVTTGMGGVTAELGGLWLREADIHFDKGGFELKVSEPLREPMERLAIHGSMGGVEATSLGNASPALLSLDCRMGGVQLDLRGDWRNDADVKVDVSMGGVAVVVPRDVDVTGAEVQGASLLQVEKPEVPLPVLRLDLSFERGEVEVVRK